MPHEAPILTVSQLTTAIKHSLESTFSLVWLQGEVSNCKVQSSGHIYFSLKDAHAQVAAVMFRGDASSLKMIPKDGDQVIIQGQLNVYPPTGKYQIVVRELRLAGLGELLLKLEELKIKLHKKGWFKAEHKKALPKFPKRIGVVTSPTGAVIQDILNILTRRATGFHLILNPVKVQGPGAAQEIAKAIQDFNTFNLVDVMIVGRGGGSIEDLWAFNEEIVAEAIFNSQIPVISAVGHETDHCIADYVADVRAPTPSAAAEIVITENAQQLHHFQQILRRLDHSMRQTLHHHRLCLKTILKQPLLASPYAILGSWMQKADEFRQELDQSTFRLLKQHRFALESREKILQTLKPTMQIFHLKEKLVNLRKAIDFSVLQKLNELRKAIQLKDEKILMDQRWKVKLEHLRELLKNKEDALKSINPRNLLTKGYTILFSEKDQSVISSVHMLKKDQKIRMLLSDGEALAQINEIYSK
ncbi:MULTISPECIES: exodeoxyribonuclease VII large subunit [Parachlamydia]|jgi:exodeoxyribonuclease VII large subunit|uniref:exodeoxyribonuclease VII large subunit n=1 Tax=Parachlamydia TaxID=83551 RepID=UPI0001C1772C|nr:exodeoxyribonuclease VII large subunit [Parachlamydia acanthamoebae]EFB41177.1 hypothetical protein pah_c050o166 [Parachlamydia acanthamoebae str. Hall's coccus]